MRTAFTIVQGSLWALGLALPVSVLASTAPASVSDAVLQCRGLPDLMARLACYDGIAVAGPVGKPAAAAAPATPATRAQVAAATTAPQVQPVQPAITTAVAPAAALAAFGLPAQPAAEAPAMSSRVQGRFEGWQRGTRLVLANGQVWEVVDSSSAFYDLPSPPVVIKRGLLGSYFIEIEGVSATPRVRRVQ